MAVPPPVGGVRSEDGLSGVEQGEQGEQDEQDVLGLDPVGTLAVVVEQRRVQDRAAAWELRAVAHWAELHRVDTRCEVGAVDLEVWHCWRPAGSSELRPERILPAPRAP
jgi:hypothetical protein